MVSVLLCFIKVISLTNSAVIYCCECALSAKLLVSDRYCINRQSSFITFTERIYYKEYIYSHFYVH